MRRRLIFEALSVKVETRLFSKNQDFRRRTNKIKKRDGRLGERRVCLYIRPKREHDWRRSSLLSRRSMAGNYQAEKEEAEKKETLEMTCFSGSPSHRIPKTKEESWWIVWS